MSRQTSDRLVPISSAIFVPLTTTVAWLMSRRTMRPRRTSVALWNDGQLPGFVGAEVGEIITRRWSLVVSRCQLESGRDEEAAIVPTRERPATNDQRLGSRP